MTSSEKNSLSERNDQRYLEFAIPVLSFGTTFAGILLWGMGLEIGFQYFSIGCVIGSCLLAYLAWVRPRKDIVALSTPIYSFIFFVVPTDYVSGVTLQLLYAVSLTLLLIRLKYRFGSSSVPAASGKELAAPLKTYVERTRGAIAGFPPEAAHLAAVAIGQFSLGEYGDAARIAGTVTGQTGQVPSLARAAEIVREQAKILEQALPRPETYRTFSPEDEGLLANPLLPTYSEDRKFDTTLENALLLLFSAAWNASESDRPRLLSCQAFVQKFLGP